MDTAPPDDPTRNRGCLSERDRDYLLGNLDDVEPASQRDREIRAIIRDRLWNTLLDFVLIWEHAEHRDLERIFVPKDLTDDTSTNVYRFFGLRSMLAVLYAFATEDSGVEQFEELLEVAVHSVEDQRSVSESANFVRLTPPDVTLTVEPSETMDLRDIEEKLDYLAAQDEWDSDLFSLQELLYLFWSVCRDESVDEDTRDLITENLIGRLEGRWSVEEQFIDFPD